MRHLSGALPVVAALAALVVPANAAAQREQSTHVISRAAGGGTPNGESTNAVISGDRRYSRLIAFESEASDLVAGDLNGHKDVFVVQRAGSFGNDGAPWRGEPTRLVSRGMARLPANGPSWGAAVSGDFRSPGRCIAFLSAASNLVPGDTNGKVDAFVVDRAGAAPERVSEFRGRQLTDDSTEVSVSGDCSRVSFVAGRKLYTKRGSRVSRARTSGRVSTIAYATGDSNALVYNARRGVWLSGNGFSRGRLVARGGRDAAFNDLKRRALAYEKRRGGQVQIFYKDLGDPERAISSRRGSFGNGHSLDPVIGNSGYYVTFESAASNLGVNSLGRTGDGNGRFDSYLFTDVRDLTLVQSVRDKAVPLPGGGQNPSMSYYANYIVFDSPAPLGARSGEHQIYMRYLGPV